MKIEISIGIIARNEENYIGNTLNSLLNINFDFSKIELILVDGNSSDKTKEIAKKILTNSKLKHKIINEKDFGFYGPCFARNLVVKNSSETSKYIAFVDADCRVDKNWLNNLYNKIKDTPKNIAGAGGPRLVEKIKNKKELIINTLLTSYIASGFNPAFTKRKIRYIPSIANYNAIYKKNILIKNSYDDKLIISDDIELNYRLQKKGYKFLYEPKAKIYHRETDSILQFCINMERYGRNISNVIYKYREPIRFFVPIILLFNLYIFTLPLFIYLFYIFKLRFLLGLSLIPLFFYILFLFLSFIEIFINTKSIYSLLVFILLPCQHILYGFGLVRGLINNIFKK